mmetsp:Transcript_25065/g.50929  ORF Transcript_25065/g.50929 Transcript_25065/m.50929 type:complete len:112 (+) Transcript_25065:406-741(+)
MVRTIQVCDGGIHFKSQIRISSRGVQDAADFFSRGMQVLYNWSRDFTDSNLRTFQVFEPFKSKSSYILNLRTFQILWTGRLLESHSRPSCSPSPERALEEKIPHLRLGGKL